MLWKPVKNAPKTVKNALKTVKKLSQNRWKCSENPLKMLWKPVKNVLKTVKNALTSAWKSTQYCSIATLWAGVTWRWTTHRIHGKNYFHSFLRILCTKSTISHKIKLAKIWTFFNGFEIIFNGFESIFNGFKIIFTGF